MSWHKLYSLLTYSHNPQALVAIFEIRSRASMKPSIVFCCSPVQIKIHEFICTILFLPKYDPRLTSMNLPPDWNLDNQIWDGLNFDHNCFIQQLLSILICLTRSILTSSNKKLNWSHLVSSLEDMLWSNSKQRDDF